MHQPIYYTATSLLCFTIEKKLKRIKCPFKVKAMESFHEIDKEAIYLVHRVYPSVDHRLLYEINGMQFPYNTFKILLPEESQ